MWFSILIIIFIVLLFLFITAVIIYFYNWYEPYLDITYDVSGNKILVLWYSTDMYGINRKYKVLYTFNQNGNN